MAEQPTSTSPDRQGLVLAALILVAAAAALNLAVANVALPDVGKAFDAGQTELNLVAVGYSLGLAASVVYLGAAPIYDLHVAGWRTFWVAALAGIIVFGTLMGAMFIGQQFLQNVLGYSTLDAGLAILPAAVGMVLMAPRSAKLVEARGARLTLLVGYCFCLLGFLVMLLLWKEDVDYWKVGLGYLLVGIGVGFAGTPAARSLTSSVPVSRAGMAWSTSDLQRDLGGAIMQSILGAVLTAGYATSIAAAIAKAPNGDRVNDNVEATLQKSFSSAAELAGQYPQYADKIIAGAKTSFLAGDSDAYVAGIIAILIGAAVVRFLFPGRDEERELLAGYAREDGGGGGQEPAPAGAAP